MIAEMRDSPFISEYGSRRALDTYQRINRWGTCVECPIHSNQIYPEQCVNTDRYDHQLTFHDIVQQYVFWKRKNGL